MAKVGLHSFLYITRHWQESATRKHYKKDFMPSLMLKRDLISSLDQHKHDAISHKKMMKGGRGDSTPCHGRVARLLHCGNDREAKGCPCSQEGFELFFYSFVWCTVFVFLHPSAALFIVSEITDQANDSMLQAVSPTMTHAPLINSVVFTHLFKGIDISARFWSLLQDETRGLIQIWFTVLHMWSWSVPFNAALQVVRHYSK